MLDIGCGPGDILKYLNDVEYFGFDKNHRHIEAARKRYGDRGTFLHKDVSTELIQEFSVYDIVLAMGILHHLDDNEAIQLLQLSKEALRPGGHLVTFDRCYTKLQPWINRYILSIDRGRYVRTKSQYTALASGVFTEIKVSIRNDLIRAPYAHIIMECTA